MSSLETKPPVEDPRLALARLSARLVVIAAFVLVCASLAACAVLMRPLLINSTMAPAPIVDSPGVPPR